jgi:membrane protease YdiL (CAAX protease family)
MSSAAPAPPSPSASSSPTPAAAARMSAAKGGLAGSGSVSSLVGLALALGGPPLYYLVLFPRIAEAWPDSLIPGAIGLGFMWLLAAGSVGVVVIWQRQPLAVLGLRPLSWRWVAFGIALGLVCGASLPLLAGVVQRVFPDDGGGTVASVTRNVPAWLMLMVVVTAACTEEVLWRASTIHQVQRLTGRIWLGAAIGLAAFVFQHVGGWSLAHIVGAVLPIGAVYTLVYVWRRNLPLVILVHFVTDLPLVLVAAGVLRLP